MAILNGDDFRGVFSGSAMNAQPDDVNEQALCDFVSTRRVQLLKAVDGAAGTPLAATLLGSYPRQMRITRFSFLPAAALTADNANFKTIILRSYNAAGTLIGIVSTNTTQITGLGNFTARVVVNLPLNAAISPVVPAEGYLEVETTVGGTGVVIPAGAFSVDAESL